MLLDESILYNYAAVTLHHFNMIICYVGDVITGIFLFSRKHCASDFCRHIIAWFLYSLISSFHLRAELLPSFEPSFSFVDSIRIAFLSISKVLLYIKYGN